MQVRSAKQGKEGGLCTGDEEEQLRGSDRTGAQGKGLQESSETGMEDLI